MASEELTSTVDKEEEPLFDPGLKKKKNKKIVDFDLDAADSNGAATAAVPAANAEEATTAGEGADDMFEGLKKKSKKKKAIPMDLVSVFSEVFDRYLVSVPDDISTQGRG